MRIRCFRRSATVAGTAAALLFVVAGVGLAAGWPGSDSPLDISTGQQVLVRSIARQDVDLAVGSGGDLAAGWASSESAPGIAIAKLHSGVWQNYLLSEAKPSWAPSILYEDNNLVAVWARGADPEQLTVVRELVGYDPGSGIQLIAGSLYGQTSPDLAMSSTGEHLVYSAADTSGDYKSTDLFYAFRASGTSTWPIPVPIVTNKAVLPHNTVAGGVFNPRVAVEPGTGVIHVVWEQYEKDAAFQVHHSVWHISRALAGPWGTPERLSPEAQRYAVLPAVAAGNDGKIHVTWTELVGSGTLLPDEQYIHYKQLGSANSVTLNGLPIHVNKNFPNWAVSSLSSQGKTVCAAWHGYTGPQGGNYEEIFFRCSQDGGELWLQTVQVSDTEDQGSVFPKLVIDQDGSVHIVWVEYETEGAGVSSPQGVFYRTGNPVHGTFLPLVLRLR